MRPILTLLLVLAACGGSAHGGGERFDTVSAGGLWIGSWSAATAASGSLELELIADAGGSGYHGAVTLLEQDGVVRTETDGVTAVHEAPAQIEVRVATGPHAALTMVLTVSELELAGTYAVRSGGVVTEEGSIRTALVRRDPADDLRAAARQGVSATSLSNVSVTVTTQFATGSASYDLGARVLAGVFADHRMLASSLVADGTANEGLIVLEGSNAAGDTLSLVFPDEGGIGRLALTIG